MKTKLFIALVLMISAFASAQTNLYSTQNQALPENALLKENTLQTIFSNLDKSRIETGLLLDAAVEFADLKKYNGIPTDSSYTSVKIVGDIYNTIVMSKVSSNQGTLKPPADFQNEWFRAQSTDLLPVGGVYYRYNQFSESNNTYFQTTAKTSSPTGRATNISTSTLTVLPNNTVADVYADGAWQNPYEISNVFAMAPIANSHNKLNFNVVFPQTLLLSNYAHEISKLEVKFSDNEAFKTVSHGQLMNVNYPAIGEYAWTYRLTLNNGQVLHSKNKFLITGDLGKYVSEEAGTAAKVNTPYKKIELEKFQYFIPFPPMVVNRPRLTLYIKYREGQTQITKPFIVVEGFDAGHITSPRREGGDNDINSFFKDVNPGYKSKLGLELDNYDIIYVDWGIGTDYIQNNAELLKKAIRWVNQNKVGAEKNVVLGQSMGGLAARYALKDMEEQGENHDAKLYISHDAPHLGANTPLGMQYMMRNISKTFLKSPIVAGTNYILGPIVLGVPFSEVLTIADTPASRQMLINYVDKNYNIDNSVHNAWQSMLKAKGYPQQTRNVAISNGSECGTDQNMQSLLSMSHASKGWFIDFIGALIGSITLDPGQLILSVLPGRSRYHYDFVVRPMTNLNENKELYNGKIVYKKNILWFIPSQNTLLSGSNYQPKGILPIDKYGGGKYRFPKNSLPKFIGDYLTVNYFSFVPTPSSIDAYSGGKTLAELDYQRSYSPVDDASVSPFHNFVIEEINGNDDHISFSSRNGRFIINQLSGNADQQNQKLTAAYLCGSKIKIGGDELACANNNATYTTGFAPYINWSVVDGANLIDITSPSNQPQISFTPKAGANGLVKLQAYLYGDGSNNTVTKDIWVGKPTISLSYQSSGDRRGLYVSAKYDDSPLEWIISGSSNAYYSTPMSGITYMWATGNGSYWYVSGRVSTSNKCGQQYEFFSLQGTYRGGDYRIVQGEDKTYKILNLNDYGSRMSDKNNYVLGKSDRTKTIQSMATNPGTETYQITIANSLGHTVISKNGDSFDLNSLPTGSYFVRIIKDNKIVASQTLIKK